jgi:hypothetical protein
MPFDKDSLGSPTGMSTGVESQTRISLEQLPPGVKPGDEVTLRVKSIDKGSQCAYLMGEMSDMPDSSPEGMDQDTNGTGQAPTSPVTGGLGTDMTLGPLGKFKNYLAKTAVDTQNQK